MLVIQIIGVLLGVIVIYLAVIIFLPVLKVDKQPIGNRNVDKTVPDCREDVSFTVNGSKLSGWFYKTQSDKPSSCIVMSLCGK